MKKSREIADLEARRDEILGEIKAIRSLKRGTINEQFLKTKVKGNKIVLNGPYFVFSRREGKKTVSKRIKKEDLKRTMKDIEAYNHFIVLCKEFEILTERLGELEHHMQDGEQEKKRHK